MIARAHADAGNPPFIVMIGDFADEALTRYDHLRAGFGEVGKIFKGLKGAGCSQVTFIGTVTRPNLGALKIDGRGMRLFPRVAAAMRKGDDGLLRTLVEIFEEEGFAILGAEEAMAALRSEAGPLGRHTPRPEDQADIAKAVRVIRALGAEDVGQAAVVAGNLTLAVEAAEGTDAVLARCADLDPNLRGDADHRRGVLVKLVKPGQERRVDLPTVGVRTVEGAARAGLAGIAVEAGASLIVDRAAVVAAADESGIFLIGIDPDDLASHGG